jgi:hypothetical protein
MANQALGCAYLTTGYWAFMLRYVLRVLTFLCILRAFRMLFHLIVLETSWGAGFVALV